MDSDRGEAQSWKLALLTLIEMGFKNGIEKYREVMNLGCSDGN